MMRYCKGCAKEQSIELFPINPRKPDKLGHRCQACHKARYLGFNRKPTSPIAGYIYLIRASNGMIKIGISINIEMRLRDLNSSSPLPLTVIYKAFSKASNILEHQLHAMFKENHSHAEWFYLTSEQVTQAITTAEEFNNHA